ncbi:TPA_inf: hypothetical protein gp_15 [Marinomonas phage YY]|uniref:ATP-binding protein n=1 Tax=Marinomonas phage YY TaxID=2163588 RepID=A0A2S1GTR0_9VIRU|nr:ATP-binding protein [Marinomonas phage YY]DBA35678.1 TPA_inf: hypothetical protein gp_15 [Marinomonas phage YY]
MTSPTFKTEITAVWGCRGSGKTTLAKKLVADHRPAQVLFIDPLAAEGVDVFGVAPAIRDGQKLVVCNAQSKDHQIGALLTAYALSTPTRPVYAICDEAPAYLDRSSAALNKIMFQGRHAGFGMCIIGQRPAAVDAQIRSQAAVTYWLKLADHVDVGVAAKSLGTERARSLQTLAPGEFIKHPE